MSSVEKLRVGNNVLWWTSSGPGGHGAQLANPEVVERSLENNFAYVAQTGGTRGLRASQLGALHAIIAHDTTESTEPITIVMPTGAGKTETMLARYCESPGPTVVVVPSDALRSQIAGKFASLGVLPGLGVVKEPFLTPTVLLLSSRFPEAADLNTALSMANVVVTTAAALAKFPDEHLELLANWADRLFIDEAHHVPAKTWTHIESVFASKPVVQFTATPYREDGQILPGKIAYSYPLHLAQRDGYFAQINYRAVSTQGDVHRSIATQAVEQLRADIAEGRDHLLMARVKTTNHADQLLNLYRDLAPEYAPVSIHHNLPVAVRRTALESIRLRQSRIIICVNMLGEGFDLPELKIAAIHDPHKSLSVSLQFIGRFAREGAGNLGSATVIVPRPIGLVDKQLRRLYSEDPDWNSVLRDVSQGRTDQEQERSEFDAGFRTLPNEVVIQSVQPKMSTVVYRSDELEWNPEAPYELFREDQLLTRQLAVNDQHHVLWFVTCVDAPITWGEVDSLEQLTYDFHLVHCDLEQGLLYINSSNNDSLHQSLAKAVGGDAVELIRGDVVYRMLGVVQRRVPTNIGLLDAVNRNRRFSMHVGSDVLEGFGPGAAQKSKTNIYAHGYVNGARASFGASRKGRVWTHRAAHDIWDWVNWVKFVGETITDESIALESVMGGFIIPQAVTERPNLVALGIEWPHDISGTASENRTIRLGETQIPLIDLDLEVLEFNRDGPIRFDVRSDEWSVTYEVEFTATGPRFVPVQEDAGVVTRSTLQPLSTFMTAVGMTIYFEKEALLSPDGYLLQPDRDRPRFPSEDLEAADWTGVNIRKESQGADRNPESVQFRTAELLQQEEEWEVVLDDDGSGELADLVFLRREGRRLKVLLAHCKFSSDDVAGARVGDLYEVCGQAQKGHKVKSAIEITLANLLRRERDRTAKGRSGFIVGDYATLEDIANDSWTFDPVVTIAIVQPGLSKARMSLAQSELLGCTQLYLSDTAVTKFRVLCSQ